MAIDNLKVIDQIPISEDSVITVKLVTPALVLPTIPESMSKSEGAAKRPPPVKVSDGVLAQWDGGDDVEEDVEALGSEGRFNWVCSVPAQGKVNLLLSWEVTAPLRTTITGLGV